jgi:hypothetical protein
MTPDTIPARTAGAINGISLAYVPGIGMERKAARHIEPAKPKLGKKATSCITVVCALSDSWAITATVRARTGHTMSRFDQVLDILRSHGLIESRKAKVGKEHRLTPEGQREQAYWRAQG